MTGRLKLVDRSAAANVSSTSNDKLNQSIPVANELLTADLKTTDAASTHAVVKRKRHQAHRLLKYSLIALVLSVLATGIAQVYDFWSNHQQTDDAAIAGHIHMISPRIPGNVRAVLVDDNQHVEKGQVLLRLDSRDYDVQVERAQAELELAQRQAEVAQSRIAATTESANEAKTRASGNANESTASLAHSEERVIDAQAALSAARQHLLQAQATLEKAQIDYKRYAYLEHQGAVSTQQLDAAKMDLSISQAAKRAAEDGIRQAQSRLAATKQSVAQARAHITTTSSELHHAKASIVEIETARKEHAAQLAAVDHARAKLQDTLLQKSYTEIVAPVSGTIGRKSVEIGQRLQPAQQIMAIVPDEVWVVANFKETQLEKMHEGQFVELKIDAFPHTAFKGRIDSLSPASGSQFALLPADNATGNFTKIVQRVPVKIVFEAASLKGYANRLAPGMSVEAIVETRH
jgi:membrane fusion protein, multidrug efflux system